MTFGVGTSWADSDRTLTHRFISQEREFYARQPAAGFLDEILKRIESEAIEHPDDKAYITDRLRSIRSMILTEMNQGYNKRITLLGDSFHQKQWRCDKLAFIYLAVAERMNWPVDIVLAPKHMFITWRLSNHESFNWETTNGKSYDDDYYLTRFKISQESINNGIYLKPLNENELQAVQYMNIGKRWFDSRQYEKALTYYNYAIELWPVFSEAYNNRAVAEIRLNRIDQALSDLKQAISLDPNCAAAYYNRGRLWLKVDRYEDALRDFTRAKKIDPNNMFLLGFINYIELILKEERFHEYPG